MANRGTSSYGGQMGGGSSQGGSGGGYGGQRLAGEARGKRGPKDWQRSDERLKEDICERLYHTSEIDSSEVSVSVTEGKVVLDGTVNDRGMKYAMEDLIDNVPGVKDIDNRVRVSRDEEGQSKKSMQAGQAGQAGQSSQSGQTTQSSYGSTSGSTTGSTSSSATKKS